MSTVCATAIRVLPNGPFLLSFEVETTVPGGLIEFNMPTQSFDKEIESESESKHDDLT